MKFTVHPKEGEPFVVQFPRLVFSEDRLEVYDSGGAASEYGFLSLENVAAIVPESQGQAKDPIMFHVYLKRGKEPIKIHAHSFKTDEPPSVRFYWRFPSGKRQVDNIYVALSEVVAIVPLTEQDVFW